VQANLKRIKATWPETRCLILLDGEQDSQTGEPAGDADVRSGSSRVQCDFEQLKALTEDKDKPEVEANDV
jgi:hypothetical protein